MKLSLCKRTLSFAMLLLLAGCSSHSDLPDFTASGYLADRGAVRIWRKNHDQQVAHLMTVYTPFSGGAVETSDYLWLQGKLVSVERHIIGAAPDDVMLRFDLEGRLSFMQRQLSGRREALSADAVALYQFDAQRMLKVSDDLLAGRVLLRQGSWQPDGTIKTCQGAQARPEFTRIELGYIARQQRDKPGAVSVAWLEAPGGTQLLQVASDDFCSSEPKDESF